VQGPLQSAGASRLRGLLVGVKLGQRSAVTGRKIRPGMNPVVRAAELATNEASVPAPAAMYATDGMSTSRTYAIAPMRTSQL
jgi:hypothetical protein